MKNKKRLKTLKIFGIFFLCGFLGYFIGKELGRGNTLKDVFHLLLAVDFYVYLAQVTSLLLAGLTMYFFHHSRLDTIAYQKAEDDEDEEGMDTFYKSSYRRLEYGTITFNLFSIILTLSFSGSLYMVIFELSHLMPLIVSLVLCVISSILFKDLQKTLKLVRQYDFPAFAMPEDALAFVKSYDEGEREANFENAFITIFQLNQIVLPALYVIIWILSMMLQEFQLVAFLVVVFVHAYINLRGIQLIKNYFK